MLRALPILIVTTRGDDASRKAVLDAGASRFMTKPFTPDAILARGTEPHDLDALLRSGVTRARRSRRVPFRLPRRGGRTLEWCRRHPHEVGRRHPRRTTAAARASRAHAAPPHDQGPLRDGRHRTDRRRSRIGWRRSSRSAELRRPNGGVQHSRRSMAGAPRYRDARKGARGKPRRHRLRPMRSSRSSMGDLHADEAASGPAGSLVRCAGSATGLGPSERRLLLDGMARGQRAVRVDFAPSQRSALAQD